MEELRKPTNGERRRAQDYTQNVIGIPIPEERLRPLDPHALRIIIDGEAETPKNSQGFIQKIISAIRSR